jgi:hydrogenase maturation protease
MTTTLVIGIGNTLAADDGIGPLAVRGLRVRTGVRVLVVHQLTPELAEELALAGRVIFVDAGLAGTEVEVTQVAPSRTWPTLAHTLTPAELLALTEAVYGRRPDAFAVVMPGSSFEAGLSLSADSRRVLPRVTQAIETLIQEANSVRTELR